MCGITGINWSDRKIINEMTELIKHRGPDDLGYYSDKNVALGHRRLSIIDLSEKGKQPMEYKGQVIVYNGEVYNFREVKDELIKRGHKFKSNTDSEVVLHAYVEWGKKCLQKFNGMFAFCIYNKKNKEFFLARDRLGIKPLYYYQNKNKFMFSSEMKSMLKFIDRKINLNALDLYFTYRFVPNNETLVNNVYKLLPGHYLIFKNNKVLTKKYWDIDFSKINKRSVDENSEELIKLLEQSIRRRMMSDVPLGVFLSGGLDSSMITAIMSKISDRPIKTFTVKFENSKYSEAQYAKIVSKQFNTDHCEINIDIDAVKVFPEVVKHLDEPIGDAATIPTYLMAKETKKHVKVILSGEGSDELFAGYDKYKVLNYSRILPPIPKIFSKGILRRVNSLFGWNQSAKYMNFVSVFDDGEKKKLYKFKHDKKFEISGFFKTGNSINNLLNFDIKTWLPNDLLLKNDKMTMAHSIEGRVPFLDHELVEFSAGINPNQKLRRGIDKFIYRQAIKKVLPKKIYKRKKQGFTIPLEEWMKKGLREYALKRLSRSRIDFLDKDYMEHVIKNATKNIFLRRQFWTLLFFVEWYGQFMEK